jgi:ACT domain-containing protein
MRAIITVVGKDKKGIIAGVSTELCANDINILDINQTIMSEFFTMVMLVDLSGMPPQHRPDSRRKAG